MQQYHRQLTIRFNSKFKLKREDVCICREGTEENWQPMPRWKAHAISRKNRKTQHSGYNFFKIHAETGFHLARLNQLAMMF